MTTIPTGAAAAGQAAAAGATQNAGTGKIGSDAFLKLLVAQLKYQDPSKPVDSSAFMAQTAQMQMVESMNQLVTQNAAIIGGQNSLSALALVGKDVSWTADGVTKSGAVQAVKLDATGPLLVVGGAEVPLSIVSRVSQHGTA
ncbi:flagellar hook capping FlgD N-terminal domain-containing protein [Arthrobacter sp. NEB 688]|uniref:flagellar hook assembly protein FlgD n=1 Tax=Arthrobacter sp. NEB 688 TaxID=904039 RepID=UPI00156371B9|nr:flagellar hook capping FlgD N-terminal domain-containing protein [Arthrobacter sp. NEB 688]QKE82668.1 flagellar hook capping protein [Arthrobacter sp. NEB 688]